MEEKEKTETAETVENTEKIEKEVKKEKPFKKEKAEKVDKKLFDELNEKYLKMLAEYDNFRKRAQKEKDGAYTDAYGDVLEEILPIKDSLEMAMAYADDGKLSQGVTMTLNKFNEVLKKLGVEEFGCEGDPFDPNLHNAILHIEDENLGENVIAKVLLKGYKKGDRVLRYAMVQVAN